ncbi:MAG: inorganic diphosphatase [Chitinophagaceae bacterium]|nr:inorganic diphosphatase [Chitinophagaceae bacterium]
MSKHPWHQVKRGEHAPQIVNAIIEISRGSKAKYEVDKDSGLLRLDRVLHSAFYYPINYGFIPQSYAGDGDPLDILVLSQIDIEPLSIVAAKVIGVMRMQDKGIDDKIIAVCADDISVSHINTLDELPPHLTSEIKHFFEQYKKLEHGSVVVDEFYNQTKAYEIINQSFIDYERDILPTLSK